MSFSEKKYIKERARKLPIFTCLVNPDWDEAGMAHILIARKMGNGQIVYGGFLVDLIDLGVKETFYHLGLTEEEFYYSLQETFPPDYFAECTPEFAHNLIYGAVDYFEEEMDVKPDKEFKLTEYLLDPDLITDEIDEMKFGFEREVSFKIGTSGPSLMEFMENNKEEEE